MKSRRSFLKRSALWATAAAGYLLPESPAGAQQQQQQPGSGGSGKSGGPGESGGPPPGVPSSLSFARKLGPRIKLSCAAYSYRQYLAKDKSMTLDDFIEKCAQMGVDGTELTSYYFPEAPSADYLNNLKRKAFLLGLDISGTAVRNNFCQPPGPGRDKDLQHVKNWIHHAARLGAPCIRIFAGSVPKGDSVEDARIRTIEGIQECCDEAGRHGVFLALENHGGITGTAEDVLALCHGVDSPWFGVNLDTGNFRTENPYRDLELVAPHAITVQLKVEISPGGKKTSADLPRILNILKSVNYRGYVVLEYEAKEDPMKAVPHYVEKLKEILS